MFISITCVAIEQNNAPFASHLLDHDGGAAAAAVADGGHAHLPRLEGVAQPLRDPGPRRPERVTQRHRAAVHVHAGVVQPGREQQS